jgi:histidine phosphotransferase ChpT
MDDRHDFPVPDLAELVGSRLCHDLVNPLSAISNGMELIGLSGAPRTPELELIGSAIDDAMARIRFFRVAFGAARAGETLSERELREILTAIYGGGRLSVEWQVTGELPRQDAKLAFLLLNCAETALPLGGVLTVRHSGEEWDISGEGRKLTIDTEIWQVLDQPMSSDLLLPPSRVQFALLAKESAVSGRRARLSMSPDMLQFTLSLTRA